MPGRHRSVARADFYAEGSGEVATNEGIADFMKSGPRRLRDAEELLTEPRVNPNSSDADRRHLRGAMYLAGYAVECMLKAYLIDQEGTQSLSGAQGKINERRASRGEPPIKDIAHTSAGHSIGLLVALTDLATRPGYEPKLWGQLSAWRTEWRYASDYPSRVEAELFIRAVRSATDWLQPGVIDV